MNKWLLFLFALTLFSTQPSHADEWFLSLGGGPQPNGEDDQTNLSAGADYSFAKWQRSYRQQMLFGISLTAIKTNTDKHNEFYAVSFYPQLTLHAPRHELGQPFFFVRALGPSYISSNQLGSRQQKHHFSFQAQVGVGLYIPWSNQQDLIASVSFKHFSNANLFSENDGIDLPLMLNLGFRY